MHENKKDVILFVLFENHDVLAKMASEISKPLANRNFL